MLSSGVATLASGPVVVLSAGRWLAIPPPVHYVLKLAEALKQVGLGGLQLLLLLWLGKRRSLLLILVTALAVYPNLLILPICQMTALDGPIRSRADGEHAQARATEGEQVPSVCV